MKSKCVSVERLFGPLNKPRNTLMTNQVDEWTNGVDEPLRRVHRIDQSQFTEIISNNFSNLPDQQDGNIRHEMNRSTNTTPDWWSIVIFQNCFSRQKSIGNKLATKYFDVRVFGGSGKAANPEDRSAEMSLAPSNRPTSGSVVYPLAVRRGRRSRAPTPSVDDGRNCVPGTGGQIKSASPETDTFHLNDTWNHFCMFVIINSFRKVCSDAI